MRRVSQTRAAVASPRVHVTLSGDSKYKNSSLGSDRHVEQTCKQSVRRCSLGFGLDILGGRGLRQNDHVIKRGEPLEQQPAAGEHRDHQWLYE